MKKIISGILILRDEISKNLGFNHVHPWEGKLHAYETGKLSPPFRDFSDADVRLAEFIPED